jgi:4-aminobutyrate aminotransferase-like enzyme
LADLVVAGKSNGGGLPLASVTGRAELLDSPALGGTLGGKPAACAGACAVLDLLPGLLPQARALGEILRARLERVAPPGADVRGLGPMLALEQPERVRRSRRR